MLLLILIFYFALLEVNVKVKDTLATSNLSTLDVPPFYESNYLIFRYFTKVQRSATDPV